MSVALLSVENAISEAVKSAAISEAVKSAAISDVRAISAAIKSAAISDVRAISAAAINHVVVYQLIAFETIKYERNRPKKFLANRSNTL